MELLLVPVPLFDKYSAVMVYLLRYQMFDSPYELDNDPLASPLLEVVNTCGVEAFAGDKPLMVPVSSRLLAEDLNRQCREPAKQIVFLSEEEIPVDETYLSNISYLRALGYGFALTGYPHSDEPETLLGITDYLLAQASLMESPNRRIMVQRYRKANLELDVVAPNIQNPRQLETASRDGFRLFDGRFYQVPLTAGESKVTPIKANLIHLLNNVRDENFEFSTIAKIVQRDPALSVSLMRLVNSPFIGVRHKIKTIQHAVTILGQLEVRKWVTAAVFKSLGTDRPSELTRLSLVRAKFAENLSPLFRMGRESQSLFLMGLFSLLDLILETTIHKALEIVSVSDEIHHALADRTGAYYPVYSFMQAYERADWREVIRVIDSANMQISQVFQAYVGAVSWYNSLLNDHVRPVK